jgi:hypothetical protein
MTLLTDKYLELLAEKEGQRATGTLTPEVALRYTAHLDQIWNELAEDEQAFIDAELSALDEHPSRWSPRAEALRIRRPGDDHVTDRYAVYYRPLGWLIDSGVGGTFSFDVTQCCEWPTVERAIDELRACNLLDKLAGAVYILRVR